MNEIEQPNLQLIHTRSGWCLRLQMVKGINILQISTSCAHCRVW